MKITIECYGKIISLQTTDDINSTELLNDISNLLLVAGFQLESINESLMDLIEERG